MSISIVIDQLKAPPRPSIIPTLYLLQTSKSQISTLSKSQLQHLTSRTLQLVRSPDTYTRWYGLNVMSVLVSNYVILANDGANFMTQLMAILENYNSTIDIVILRQTIECLMVMMREVRDKPTLTREILTPKLGAVIALLTELVQFDATLCISSLFEILSHHPTTFRPHANKFRAKLVGLVRDGFGEFPSDLKMCVGRSLAMLPVIEKNEPEAKWGADVRGLIGEICGLVNVYAEFLNFRDDSSLAGLIAKLPQGKKSNNKDNDGGDQQVIFDPLDIDLNRLESVFGLSDRVECLMELLSCFLTTGGVSRCKVPLGSVLVLCELIFSINTRFLSFKSDVRDSEVRQVVQATLNRNYIAAYKLMNSLLSFRGALVPHLGQILNMMEFIIPMVQNKKINSEAVKRYDEVYVELISCVSNYLDLVGVVSDQASILPFVDVALILIEPRNLEASSQPQDQQQQLTGGNTDSTGKKHAKKRKNQSAAPLSDILSHQHLFQSSVPQQSLTVVESFLNRVIRKAPLPSNQHYKILKFIIRECIQYKNSSLEHSVPKQLRELLVGAVLNPGYGNNNILPIVSSILGHDETVSVFNNPRLPALPQYRSDAVDEDFLVEEEEREEGDGGEVTREVSAKELAIQKLLKEQQAEKERAERERQAEAEANARVGTDADADEGKETKVDYNFSIKRPLEEETGRAVIEKKAKVEEKKAEAVVETKNVSSFVNETEPAGENKNDEEENLDDGSDFEMPEINMESDTEEEEEEE
ncbi:uncharacterized protein LODBEIA_P39880 [Lodderomyces beijingensis]|uniref:Pre-rRNA-processing protein RIX1 n=1 Tax=Lodderomyces beijingensis TaxID=1775926 RepID=A0ABP0ZNN7_9ASCO